MKRFLFGALVALLTLSGAGVAAAGGWAMTSFDSVPSEFEANTTYTLGYTILQHGVQPVDLTGTEVRVANLATGEVEIFPGIGDGAPGHYTVDVRFPASGTWTWEIHQGDFGPQSLGEITVGARTAATSAGSTALTALGSVLLVATVLAAAASLAQLAVLIRRRSPVVTDAG